MSTERHQLRVLPGNREFCSQHEGKVLCGSDYARLAAKLAAGQSLRVVRMFGGDNMEKAGHQRVVASSAALWILLSISNLSKCLLQHETKAIYTSAMCVCVCAKRNMTAS